MLKTDCIIPKHVPIPHPDHYTLYGDARAVKALMDEGLGKWSIIKKLRLSEEAYTDAMYEIKKQKAVEEMNGRNQEMPRGKLINAETVERIREMHAEGKTYQEIAEELGFGKSTIARICSNKPVSHINKEFDDAVNEMIAEAEKPEQIDQVAEPVTMTEEHTAEPVPDAVLKAVADKIEALSEILSDNLLTIKKLQQDNEQIRSELAVLYGWRAEHEGAEN